MDVQRIAELAMLHIEEAELPRFEKDMEDIVAMVQQLPELEELPSVEKPMLMREDIAGSEMISRETLLLNAPETQNGCLVVPQTVEQG